ncbi:glycoside hydrolase family 2 TIM barrel-domain containing protein [Pedobacter sp. AW31-3R]|uniref:glycoside hydrolase family 2 TIM barrel-domain containing protein n=1 Tax=Pedobacter sp. AW31-3R TaxID=3445781 RepID=UPI003FA0B05B
MNKHKYILLLMLLLTAGTAVGQGSVRITADFNQGWKFLLGNPSRAYETAFNDTEWRNLSLPHDWSIEGDFKEEHPATNAGGALPGGTGWYRKTFRIPSSAVHKTVYIDFGGVYRNSEVWINGHYLGKRPSGYTSFRYELTPYLKTGKVNNVIAVKVDNSLQPNSRWYSGSGIYRNVRLITTSKIAVAHWGTFVTTPEVSDGQAKIHQQLTIRNYTLGARNVNPRNTNSSKAIAAVPVNIELTLMDSEGKKVAGMMSRQTLKDSLTTLEHQFKLDNPILWSVENPYQYTLVTRIRQGNQLLDEYKTPLGIRYFDFDARKGFRLNGKALKILGVCMHHDLGALGASVNVRAMERQLEILKDMGCNAIRMSHNPPAAELLDLCDRMGFLVMDEAFDMWKKKKNKYDYSLDFSKWHKADLEDMVKRDRNHPSVIMWSVGNEIREQFDSTGTTIVQELVALVKNLDKTRPVTTALTETDSAKNFIAKAKVLDVMGFNYKYEEYDLLPLNFPGQKFIASETTSALETRGIYDTSDTLRFWPSSGKQKFVLNGRADWTASAYDNTAAYWGTTHEKAWLEVKKRDFLAGLFVWSGFDFIGEPVPYPYPARSSYYGIVDLAGFPKDVYYMYKSEWTSTPVLHLFPHWNWNSGDTVDVWAYFNQADEVELFLNGKSLGTRKKEKDLHVSWKVKYEAGLLKAVSRKAGKEVLSTVIETAGKPFKIVLEADRTAISADGKDLSFITVKVTDEKGNMVPDADQLINFEVTGPAEIAGVDNGYQASHEPFKANYRKAFKGKCLVILQSNGKAGPIQLKAKSAGLSGAAISLNSK